MRSPHCQMHALIAVKNHALAAMIRCYGVVVVVVVLLFSTLLRCFPQNREQRESVRALGANTRRQRNAPGAGRGRERERCLRGKEMRRVFK